MSGSVSAPALRLNHDASGRLDGSAIRHLEFFAGLDAVACDEIARAAHARRVGKGEAIYSQGEMPRHQLLVLSGRFKVIHVTPEGSRIAARLLGPGDLADYVSIFDAKPYPASAIAVTESIALAWPRETFLALMPRHPPLALAVIRMMGRCLEEADTRLRESATERVERRVAHAILRLVRQAGRRVEGGVEIPFAVTRHDIALMSGANLYTVSRTLSAWEQRGIIAGGRQRLVLCDPHALVRIAEEIDGAG